MKKFEFGINKILVDTGYYDTEIAEDNFSYEILERKEGGSFDDEFTVLVIVNDTGESEKITVKADKDIYLNELDDIIWERIADFYVTETK
ncbi:hypothetical protein EK546_09365 [Salmonella enterica]|nr:hypothetical protein [Salmonella enterica]